MAVKRYHLPTVVSDPSRESLGDTDDRGKWLWLPIYVQ